MGIGIGIQGARRADRGGLDVLGTVCIFLNINAGCRNLHTVPHVNIKLIIS